jgi:soluble lytic murein transglycosylase
MLDAYKQNPVLATAAYNAGPGRVRQWLPNQRMDADTWIATIPFKETREYVQNVMIYTAIYQQLLGKKPTLAAYMPHIPEKTHD